MKYELNNIGDDTYLIFSRGHHNLKEFTNYVKEEYSEWGNFFEVAYHHYYRKIGNQYGTWYEPCFPWTRGAFKVTVAQEGWTDQTMFVREKLLENKVPLSIGNYFVIEHHCLKDRYEIWYSEDNFTPTELCLVNGLSEAREFIYQQMELGRHS